MLHHAPAGRSAAVPPEDVADPVLLGHLPRIRLAIVVGIDLADALEAALILAAPRPVAQRHQFLAAHHERVRRTIDRESLVGLPLDRKELQRPSHASQPIAAIRIVAQPNGRLQPRPPGRHRNAHPVGAASRVQLRLERLAQPLDAPRPLRQRNHRRLHAGLVRRRRHDARRKQPQQSQNSRSRLHTSGPRLST